MNENPDDMMKWPKLFKPSGKTTSAYEPNAVCWPISPRDCHFSL